MKHDGTGVKPRKTRVVQLCVGSFGHRVLG